ncbi:juvenile hormone esterase-like, partial [Schistocerca nitens]|uniref:juvenile hormone esterase-like n=1 Tax=Schistocerca nitens TaxID=7011 RepID=UPI0021195C37
APQPAASWSEVRDALSFADACAQPLFFGLIPITTGSEDCLYLNVYAPAAASGPYPVMVYIHGGAFKGGSSSSSTPHSFVEKGVVLVTIAYRLGALGFLSLLNDDIPGNAGFKDQVLALQWVQRNIAAFGGDPSSVVIFGESAGGGSTSHLFLSPATKGLFSGVSMESGVATTSWALTDKPRERAYRMAEAVHDIQSYKFQNSAISLPTSTTAGGSPPTAQRYALFAPSCPTLQRQTTMQTSHRLHTAQPVIFIQSAT